MRKTISSARLAAAGVLGVILLLALDQWTKALAISGLKDKPSIPLINGVLELKYLENRGMAFGLLQGKTVFFLLICLVFFLAAAYVCVRMPKETYYLPLFGILFLLLSGAAGNFIDRIFRGYVVDFIYVSLIDFPIFNLADVYVVTSGILLVLFVCLKYKDEDFSFLKRGKRG